MKPFQLTIVTQGRLVLTEAVASVTVPAYDGERTVMADHDRTAMLLCEGRLFYRRGDEDSPVLFDIGIGCAEVTGDAMRVIVTSAKRIVIGDL